MIAESKVDFTIADTRIETAGVMRCCLTSVAEEYLPARRVASGATSRCQYCRQAFTLVAPAAGKVYPVWKPDWQIKRS